MQTITKRRSRMSRSRKRPALQLTARDVDILLLLARYRYLRSTFIHALVGGNLTALLWRLRDLFDGGYVARPNQQWQFANSRYLPTIYALDQGGEELLRTQGLIDFEVRSGSARQQFPHDLMVSDILASVEIGVRGNPALRIIHSSEILERAPQQTQEMANPLAFAVNNTHLIPDALFAIKGPEGVVLYALEADRQNEPLRRRGHGSNYATKFENYRALVKGEIYKQHLGTKVPAVVLHLTTNERRMRNMMELAGPTPYNLFKSIASFGNFQQAPLPSPSLFVEPWARNGYPDFPLNR